MKRKVRHVLWHAMCHLSAAAFTVLLLPVCFPLSWLVCLMWISGFWQGAFIHVFGHPPNSFYGRFYSDLKKHSKK